MKSYQLAYVAAAEDTLAELFLDPQIRGEVSMRCDEADSILTRNPREAGESRETTRFGQRRVLLIGRLQLSYAISEPRRLVIVRRVAWQRR